MPTSATTDPNDLNPADEYHGQLGGCAATMMLHEDGSGDVNDIYKLDAAGCAPYIGRITCENDVGAALKVVRNKFADIEAIARVPAGAWNLIASGDSTAPFVTSGTFVIVHNDGASLGDNIQCRLQSPEHYCFGFPYEIGKGYLDYTHLREAGAELDTVSVASSIFPGCAGSRTEAEALNADADAGGCACVPEAQDKTPNNGIFAPFIPKGTEGDFASINPNGVFDQTITISTACSGHQPLEVDDQFGMFKLVGFADSNDRTSITCGACIDDPNSKKVCQGPGFDGSDTQSLVSRTICDLETQLKEDEFTCPTAAGQAEQSTPGECYCGTVRGVGSSPQQYCLFHKGSFGALSGNWKEVKANVGAPATLTDVPNLSFTTEAVADQTPCCEHYWETCAILQASGTAVLPRSGEYDWLATTPTDNMVEALRNIGVDTDGGAFRVSNPEDAGHAHVDRGEECAVSISPTLGIGDVSLVLRDTTAFDLNPIDPVIITSCYFDNVIPLYCDDGFHTYVTSADQKFCCSGVLLDADTSNLNSLTCLAPSTATTTTTTTTTTTSVEPTTNHGDVTTTDPGFIAGTIASTTPATPAPLLFHDAAVKSSKGGKGISSKGGKSGKGGKGGKSGVVSTTVPSTTFPFQGKSGKSSKGNNGTSGKGGKGGTGGGGGADNGGDGTITHISGLILSGALDSTTTSEETSAPPASTHWCTGLFVKKCKANRVHCSYNPSTKVCSERTNASSVAGCTATKKSDCTADDTCKWHGKDNYCYSVATTSTAPSSMGCVTNTKQGACVAVDGCRWDGSGNFCYEEDA
jgi:hypothetical protein